MPSIISYRDLNVWQDAMNLAVEAYRVTATFPAEERFGLALQMRKSAVSIPSNVAEGHCRRRRQAYSNHVSIARGSHGELETQMELSERLGYSSEEDTRLRALVMCVGKQFDAFVAIARSASGACE